MPLERDEGEYAYMGQLMLEGIPPYKLAANMKLPGTYMGYAAIMAVFGESASGIRLGMTVVTTAAAVLLFLLGKRLYGPMTGSIAGATYAFLAARPAVLGLDGHATHFVVLAALAGILLLLFAIEHGRTGLFFASGIAFGLSFLMKQPGILFAFFAGCYWLYLEWKRGLERKNVVSRGSALVVGTALPYALTCLWLWRAGVFSNFWFWTWTYARQYGAINDLSEGWKLFNFTFEWAVRPFALWEIALVGLTAPLWSRLARQHGGCVAGFFLISVLAVVPGLYFRPHYYIVLFPAAALCMGLAVESAWHELYRLDLRRLALVPIAYFLIVYIISVHSQWTAFFRLDPDSLSRKTHYDQPYADAATVADLIAHRATPQDQIGIIGSEPEVCFYTHLRCTSSFLYMYPLMERQPFASKMQTDFKRELENARPRFLLYVDDERSWGWKATLVENESFLNWGWDFAHTGYQLVDRVPAPDIGSYPEHLWGDRASIYVFERKEGLGGLTIDTSPSGVILSEAVFTRRSEGSP